MNYGVNNSKVVDGNLEIEGMFFNMTDGAVFHGDNSLGRFDLSHWYNLSLL